MLFAVVESLEQNDLLSVDTRLLCFIGIKIHSLFTLMLFQTLRCHFHTGNLEESSWRLWEPLGGDLHSTIEPVSTAVFLNPGPGRPPQHCTLSLLSDSPISRPGLSSNELMSWIRCVWLGRHTKCAGGGGGWETLVYALNNTGSLLASMALWRTLNIHGTFQMQKRFFRVLKCSSNWFFKELFTERFFGEPKYYFMASLQNHPFGTLYLLSVLGFYLISDNFFFTSSVFL